MSEPSAGPVGDLPDEAVEAAAVAMWGKWANSRDDLRDCMRGVLAAALPLIRAHIAGQIEAEKAAYWTASAPLRSSRIGNAKCEGAQIGLAAAARVARGGNDA